MNTHAASHCPHCHRHGTLRSPSGRWKVAIPAAYAVFAVMIFGAGLLGPTIMAVLPLLAAYGLGVLPFVHGKAAEPTTCTACDRIVEHHAPGREATVAPAPAIARAA